MDKIIRHLTAKAILDEAEWIESHLVGLLAAGVAPAEIEIRRWTNDPGRVAIAVRGESRFERCCVFLSDTQKPAAPERGGPTLK